MSEWKVKLNAEKEFEINQTKEGTFVDGRQLDIDLLKLEEGKFHLLHQQRSYSASLIELDSAEKKLKIKINNTTYDLELEDNFDQLLQQLGMDDLAGGAIAQLKAPMPGLVLQVMVEEGQEVAKDDPLLILEAMKMENVLKAPSDAKIKKVAVEEKQTVEKNQILIEFE